MCQACLLINFLRVLNALLRGAGRDVVPVSVLPGEESEVAFRLGVFDSPSARQQLERACAELLDELRRLVAASDAEATIEISWAAAVDVAHARIDRAIGRRRPRVTRLASIFARRTVSREHEV